MIIFSLNLSLSLLLSLSLSLSIEPPWEGGGAILGTTPHPAMLLNMFIISLTIMLFIILYYTISIFIIIIVVIVFYSSFFHLFPICISRVLLLHIIS